MVQTNSYILENNEQYVEVNSLSHEDNKYVLLSNVSNPKDICIRKIVKENDKEQFDTSKQTTINKTIAKSIVAELDKVINNEN